MSMAPSNIAIGSEVYTTDGDKLGTVKMVRSGYFQVDASMRPDYWLSMECLDNGGGYEGTAGSESGDGGYESGRRLMVSTTSIPPTTPATSS